MVSTELFSPTMCSRTIYAVKYHFNNLEFRLNIISTEPPMKLRTRSILQELNEIAEVRNKDALFESRATNIINSAINLLESLHKQYTAEQADELERRFLNAIRGQDPAKFTRGIRKIVESRKTNKSLDQDGE